VSPRNRAADLVLRVLEGVVIFVALVRWLRAPRVAASTPNASVEIGYETRDLAPKAILVSALILIVVLGLVVVGVTVLQASLSSRPVVIGQPIDLTTAQPTPSAPEPRLEVQPGGSRPYREAQQQKLQTYGWVDRPSGRVRIPIERAMQLVVEGQSP
jgi:hypothetical protein